MFPRVLILSVIGLTSTAANAQWWSFAPRDYEECAKRAETINNADERRSLISACDSKFVGRRKPGGGYSYFDFMQNRSFDIAGPNPTPDELRKFDEEYIGYLDRQRRAAIAAALLAKQREQALADFNMQAPPKRTDPIRLASTDAQRPLAKRKTAKPKAATCGEETLSCTWSKLSTGVKNFFSVAKPVGGTRS
ncbi:hypothetical protein [Bradyrhizobium prioriisuperbiae]|uniref:hypothetical protein n=1 Tax=Bradyrhizobium prioriisuperbiae TaxID=2854389 RepID=UPI0028E51954|nr:hypothetical protein [Bradyrhizobium prioritasuperba]